MVINISYYVDCIDEYQIYQWATSRCEGRAEEDICWHIPGAVRLHQSSTVETYALCCSILTHYRAGETKVWPTGMEYSIRIQPSWLHCKCTVCTEPSGWYGPQEGSLHLYKYAVVIFLSVLLRVCVGIQYATCLVRFSMVAGWLMIMINDCSTHMPRWIHWRGVTKWQIWPHVSHVCVFLLYRFGSVTTCLLRVSLSTKVTVFPSVRGWTNSRRLLNTFLWWTPLRSLASTLMQTSRKIIIMYMYNYTHTCSLLQTLKIVH